MPRTLTTTSHPLVRRWDLLADDRAPGQLRRHVAAALADWQLGRLADDLALIATELATNAVRHAGTPARVTLALCEPKPGRHVVRLEVEDSGPGFDPAAPVPASDCSGRGLQLVAAVSDAWGVLPLAAGLLAWAELAAPLEQISYI
ncbi:ATP-binding protein [Kitasatospora sp. NPDC004289]